MSQHDSILTMKEIQNPILDSAGSYSQFVNAITQVIRHGPTQLVSHVVEAIQFARRTSSRARRSRRAYFSEPIQHRYRAIVLRGNK